MADKWVPNTQRFITSLNRVHSQFQEIVGTELKQSLTFQNEVIDTLKAAEQQAAVTTTQVSKHLNNSSANEIANSVSEIEALLETIESKLSECVDSIVNIDTQLTPPQRLLAAQLPRTPQFPLLHDQIRKSSIHKTPTLLDAHRSKAESSVCNEHAVNTTKFMSKDTN